MTFDEWWRQRVAKTPQLVKADTRMTISVAEFQKHLQRAYEAGYDEANDASSGDNFFSNLFGDLFSK